MGMAFAALQKGSLSDEDFGFGVGSLVFEV